MILSNIDLLQMMSLIFNFLHILSFAQVCNKFKFTIINQKYTLYPRTAISVLEEAATGV